MYSVLFEDAFNLSISQSRLLEKIFGKRWSTDFSGMPFEHLMECCPSEEKANYLMNKLYNCRRPNALHQALAKGLADGSIHSIITTNYDSCIEESLEHLGTAFTKIVTSEQAEAALEQNNRRYYFKIHGSAEEEMESTPMFSLKHEGLLHPKKRALLSKLVSGRSLVLLGYSGLDFELCPEIERLNLKEIIWNNLRNEYPSVSAKRLIERKDGILLSGDMRVLIDNWLGIDRFPELTQDKTEYVKEQVNQIFTAEEIDYWRIKVLSSLGIPSFALKILETNKSISNSYFIKIQKGRFHFHAGRYKTARRYFMCAVRDELLHGKALTAADGALEMSDAYRSYGSPIRAHISTFLVSILAQKTLRAKKLLKQSLVVKDAIEISTVIGRLTNSKFPQIAFFSSYIFASLISGLQKILSQKLIECAKEALKTGNWIDFQQVALIAESLEVDISSVSSDEYYLPPKAAEGYRHLAYYVPQTMIFYDYCLKNKNHLATDVNIKAEWKKHVKTCRQLGLNSSLWKILALSESQEIKNEARDIFNKCEYGFFKRIFDWRKFARTKLVCYRE